VGRHSAVKALPRHKDNIPLSIYLFLLPGANVLKMAKMVIKIIVYSLRLNEGRMTEIAARI